VKYSLITLLAQSNLVQILKILMFCCLFSYFMTSQVPVRHTSSWKRSAGGKQRREKGNRPRDLGRSAPDAGQRGSLNCDPPEERNPEKPSQRKNEAPIFRGGSRICSPPKVFVLVGGNEASHNQIRLRSQSEPLLH